MELQAELTELNTQLSEYQADLEVEKKVLENGEIRWAAPRIWCRMPMAGLRLRTPEEEAAQVVEGLEAKRGRHHRHHCGKAEGAGSTGKEPDRSAERFWSSGIIEARAQLEKRNLKYKNAEGIFIT